MSPVNKIERAKAHKSASRVGDMSKEFEKVDFETSHHKPRSLDKKKKHRRGFSEDKHDNRHARINFKRYVQELEEDRLDNEIDENL